MINHEKQLMDLHNHTTFSDGENTIEEIIINATNHNIKIVGISDHFHQISDLKMYFRIINYFKETYSSQIKIFSGIEIDITKCDSLNNMDSLKKTDYILIENIEYLTDLDLGLEVIDEYTRHNNKIIIFAHLNFISLIKRFGYDGFKKILSFMQKHGIWWEINSNYATTFYDNLLYHPSAITDSIIQRIKNYRIETVAGSDTHSLEYYDFKRLKDANNYYKTFED